MAAGVAPPGLIDTDIHHKRRRQHDAIRSAAARVVFSEGGGDRIPTGNILETKPGTMWNFRTAKGLRDSSGAAIGYDGNMVLNSGRDPAGGASRRSALNVPWPGT